MTNAPRYNVGFLEAWHRSRGRCEKRIKILKDTGLDMLTYFSHAANEARANLAIFAMNLVSWIRIAILPAGHAAGIWDVKRSRYWLFLMAGKLVRSGRQQKLLLPRMAPEAELVMELRQRINHAYQHFRHGNLVA